MVRIGGEIGDDIDPEVVITRHGSEKKAALRDVSTEPVMSEVEGLDLTKKGDSTA
jgi:hypothetical protein